MPKILLDTDPGGDDSVALLWLESLAQQGLAELVGVTAADGNVAARQTAMNARRLLTLLAVDVPVGIGQPVLDSPADATHIHGIDGMGNLSTTLPSPPETGPLPASDDLIIELLTAQPGTISLVAIGPLTNLAAAEQKHPGILGLAKEIIVMGGAIAHAGNVTPHAEFNIWFNPEAAAQVVACRSDTVLIPLDITSQLQFTRAMAADIHRANPGSAIAQFIVALCEFMAETALGYRETNGSAFLVHDAATLAYLVYPHLFTFRRARLAVETEGSLTRGQTLVDTRPGPKLPANAWIAQQIDVAAFFTYLCEDLKRLVREAHP